MQSNYFQSTIFSLQNAANDNTLFIENREVLLEAISLLIQVKARKVEKKTLKNVKITELSSKKYDDVVYFFETPRGTYGPYKGRLPQGTIEKLGLQKGDGWEIETEKVDGQWHWLEAFRYSDEEDESDTD